MLAVGLGLLLLGWLLIHAGFTGATPWAEVQAAIGK